MNDTAMWDRFGTLVRGILPEWARYQGHGTYALAGYAYAVGFAAVSAVLHAGGHTTVGLGLSAFAVLALSVGRYYHTAARLRVTCDACGATAGGATICPECDQRTFGGGQ